MCDGVGVAGEGWRGGRGSGSCKKVEENQINNSDKMPHLSPAISGVRPTWLVLAAANAAATNAATAAAALSLCLPRSPSLAE